MAAVHRSASLALCPIKGTASVCGEEYGARFSDLLEGFCAQEAAPDKKRLAYARKCYPLIQRYAPLSAEFMKGISKGSSIGLDAVVLLSLHEELYHERAFPSHCTAIVATPDAVKSGKTIVGQNWDWQPQLYAWPGLLKLSIKGTPTVLAYHYPGLWNCCGINSKGLALMWTGGGYYPPLAPVVGVPTYVLISELLRMKTVEECLAFLDRTPRAGSFMFILADASGQSVIIEATPSMLGVERVQGVSFRANLYTLPGIKKESRQHRPNEKRQHSLVRMAAVERYLAKRKEKLNADHFKAILCDPNVFVNRQFQSVTVDQFIAICEERVLLVRRGGSGDGHEWARFKL